MGKEIIGKVGREFKKRTAQRRERIDNFS